jgi:hypothetical protein
VSSKSSNINTHPLARGAADLTDRCLMYKGRRYNIFTENGFAIHLARLLIVEINKIIIIIIIIKMHQR